MSELTTNADEALAGIPLDKHGYLADLHCWTEALALAFARLEGINMINTPDAEPGLPPSLRFLKGLVITLMITMIVGVITVVWLLVTRMPDASSAAPQVPETLSLPEGLKAEAVTLGKGWIAVVTSSQEILIFDPSGSLLQRIDLQLTPAP